MKYNKWIMPSLKDIKKEYKIEYTIKGLSRTGIFPTEQSFIDAVYAAEIVTVTPSLDNQIYNRSQTQSKEELHNLIRGYRSYPEFRNEKTLNNLYERFKTNKELDMPLVLKYPNGTMRMFAGNTRMDVAFQLGINPKVIMVEVPNLNESKRRKSNSLRKIIREEIERMRNKSIKNISL